MKLMRYGAKGAEKPALVDAQGTVRDLSGVVPDITAQTMRPENLKRLAELDASKLPAVASPGRIAPPWSGMGKFICIGLNYSDHAAETGSPIPKEPIIFMKPTNVVVGCNDAVVLPKDSVKTDWEVELGVVIGTKARYVEKADEIKDPQALAMWLDVNGQRRQDGSTKTMIFGVAELVAYCSRFMTLWPGDLITTGTPPGVALGMKPTPVFLKAGDDMRLGITGLGEQRQKVHAWSAALIDN